MIFSRVDLPAPEAPLMPTTMRRASAMLHFTRRTSEAIAPRVIDFAPIGSDERQYGSPGYRLPVGSLMRTQYGTYREYHTSLDDKEFMRLESVQRTLDAYQDMCLTLDGNGIYVNLQPYGEPQLGRRGLYPDITVAADNVGKGDAVLWTLNLSDGETDLLGIAEEEAEAKFGHMLEAFTYGAPPPCKGTVCPAKL